MADEIRNDIQEENRMEERPDPDHSYYPETSGRYPYGESSPAVAETNDDGGIGAAEVAVAGAAVVGIGTIGYGIYRGVKWIVDKIRGVDDEDDEDEEDKEKPRRSRKKQGKKKVIKKKTTSRKKAKEPDPDDEEDFEEEDNEESENK